MRPPRSGHLLSFQSQLVASHDIATNTRRSSLYAGDLALNLPPPTHTTTMASRDEQARSMASSSRAGGGGENSGETTSAKGRLARLPGGNKVGVRGRTRSCPSSCTHAFSSPTGPRRIWYLPRLVHSPDGGGPVRPAGFRLSQASPQLVSWPLWLCYPSSRSSPLPDMDVWHATVSPSPPDRSKLALAAQDSDTQRQGG